MNFLNFLFAVVAVSNGVAAIDNATCGEASRYCSSLDSRDGYECRKQISQRKLDIATCQPAPQTLTSTFTLRPTTTVTETVSPLAATTKELSTITLLGNPATEPTTTLTATTTVILGTITITDTTSSTQYEVSTETQTWLETDTVASTTLETWPLTTDQSANSNTSTLSSTTTIPWVTQACGPSARRRVFKFGRGDSPFPNKCSCYLTATEGAPSLKTATVTITEDPVTQTVLQKGTQTPTITRTVIATAYLNVSTVIPPEVTETITESVTETSRSLATTVDTEIFTVTSTETRTTREISITRTTVLSTATADPCADTRRLSIPSGTGLSGPSIALFFRNAGGRNDDQILSCCRSCFDSPGCVFFRANDDLCEGFGVKENITEPCTSNRCPRGQPAVLHELVDDGYEYFSGECGKLV